MTTAAITGSSDITSSLVSKDMFILNLNQMVLRTIENSDKVPGLEAAKYAAALL